MPGRTSQPKPKTATPRRAGTARPRPAAAPAKRTTPSLKRRKPEPESNAKKVIGAVSAALPGLLEKAGKPAKKAKPAGKAKGAAAALGVAGAGFAAFKQRAAKKDSGTVVAPASPPAATPAAPVASNGLADSPIAPPSDTAA